MRWLVIGIISGLLLLSSCREETEGCCDDSFANNFDPEAEKRTCCEYPVFTLGMSHFFSDDSVSVIPDTGIFVLSNDPTDSFQIISSAWFFQGFQIFIDDEWIDLEEQTTIIEKNGDEREVIENFDVHERRLFRLADLGELRRSERPDSLRFSLGWEAMQFDTSDISLGENQSLLNAKDLKLYNEDHSILQGRLELRYLEGTDTSLIELPINGHTQLSYSVDPETWERGFDRRIQLSLSYDELLANYSLQNNVEANVEYIQSNIINETFELDTIY